MEWECGVGALNMGLARVKRIYPTLATKKARHDTENNSHEPSWHAHGAQSSKCVAEESLAGEQPDGAREHQASQAEA